MKTMTLLTLALLTSISVIAADSATKGEVAAAAKKLGEQASYTWKSTVVVPESSQFKPGPTDGKTEKDGFTYVTMSFGDNLTGAVMMGEKATITDQDGNWKLASELENAGGQRAFLDA